MTTDELERLGAALIERPLYVALQSDGIPSPLPGAWGCTSPTIDLLLRPWLESSGRWRGRQAGIFIGDELLREAVTEEAAISEMLLAVLAHELSHVVDQGIDLGEATIERTNQATALAAFSGLLQDSLIVPPFWGHGPNWLRATLHLHHRMSTLGHAVPVNWLFAGEHFALAEPDQWAYVLSDEPEALAGVPIFDVLTFRPPFAFADLWRRCVEHWRDLNPSRCDADVERSLSLFGDSDK